MSKVILIEELSAITGTSVGELDKLMTQYLSDFDRFYYPSILCTREELSIKRALSYTLKDDLREIKDLFTFSKDFDLWYQGVLLPLTDKILENHAKLLHDFMR